MAKGRSSRGARDAYDIASLLSPLPMLELTPLRPPVFPISEVVDERRFNPVLLPRRLSTSGTAVPSFRAVPRRSRARSAVDLSAVHFATPQRTIECVRRKERREVIFALRRQRKGAGASRRRYNFWSKVRC